MTVIVARDSSSAAATPRGSPPTRVTSAASIATSAPVPIAIPRSAWASAGASLIPSPTMATDPPAGLQPLDDRGLVRRAGPRPATRSAGIPTCAATARAVARVVAGDEPDLDALPRVSSAHGRRRLGLDRVGDRRGARQPAVDGDAGAASVAGAMTRSASPASGARSMPASASSRALPTRTARRRRRATALDPAARRRPRSRGPARTRARRARARATIAAPSGCSLPRLDRRRQVEQLARRRRRAPRRPRRPSAGRAVSVPVLSKTTVSTRWAASSASPPRIRMPASAPRPVPTMIAVGVARPMAHGQAMTTTLMNAVSASVSRGSGPNSEPDRRTSPRRGRGRAARTTSAIRSARRWIGRLAALGPPDELDDPGERRVAPDARGPHDERAGRVERRADDLVARRRPRPGSARRSASTASTADAALDDDAVDRDLLAGPDPQAGRRRPTASSATSRLAGRRRRRRAVAGLQADQPPDRAGRAGLGPRLQPAAEQDQADDDRRRVEVRLRLEAGLDGRPSGHERDDRRCRPRPRVVPTATSVSMFVGAVPGGPPGRAVEAAARPRPG